jgi:hypothetical protein
LPQFNLEPSSQHCFEYIMGAQQLTCCPTPATLSGTLLGKDGIFNASESCNIVTYYEHSKLFDRLLFAYILSSPALPQLARFYSRIAVVSHSRVVQIHYNKRRKGFDSPSRYVRNHGYRLILCLATETLTYALTPRAPASSTCTHRSVMHHITPPRHACTPACATIRSYTCVQGGIPASFAIGRRVPPWGGLFNRLSAKVANGNKVDQAKSLLGYIFPLLRRSSAET